MKTGIHPKTITDAHVVCSCGATFTTISTKPSIKVDVCWKCHPVYTGEHRFIDIKGRVESFQKKQEIAKSMKEKVGQKKAKKRIEGEQRIRSLKELLNEV